MRQKRTQANGYKHRVECLCHELVNKFEEMLPTYMNHVARIRHQYAAIKRLKGRLLADDLLIHVDWSENYACKWTNEIQSCHFAGNRSHITLHTGVLYEGQKTQAFCTASMNLHHDAVAIYTHLEPILKRYPHIVSPLPERLTVISV